MEHYFRTSLFWHKYWIKKGRPEEGIIADIRRNTRANYHKARKMVTKFQDSIQSNKLAESLVDDTSKVFWNKVRKSRGNNQRLPNCVDDKQGPEEIAQLFHDDFENLYNCVSYNNVEMDNLMADINEAISNTNSTPRGNLDEQILLIHPDEVKKAIGKLKSGKTDGSLPLLSENLIHSSDILYGHLALLFSMMLRHGFSPYGC